MERGVGKTAPNILKRDFSVQKVNEKWVIEAVLGKCPFHYFIIMIHPLFLFFAIPVEI